MRTLRLRLAAICYRGSTETEHMPHVQFTGMGQIKETARFQELISRFLLRPGHLYLNHDNKKLATACLLVITSLFPMRLDIEPPFILV